MVCRFLWMCWIISQNIHGCLMLRMWMSAPIFLIIFASKVPTNRITLTIIYLLWISSPCDASAGTRALKLSPRAPIEKISLLLRAAPLAKNSNSIWPGVVYVFFSPKLDVWICHVCSPLLYILTYNKLQVSTYSFVSVHCKKSNRVVLFWWLRLSISGQVQEIISLF